MRHTFDNVWKWEGTGRPLRKTFEILQTDLPVSYKWMPGMINPLVDNGCMITDNLHYWSSIKTN